MHHETIEIAGRRIGRGEAPFVVAEVACAHEGSALRALGIVEALADSTVDAIQLQLFRTDELVAVTHSRRELVAGLEIDPAEWRGVLRRARDARPQLWVNVFDEASLALALEAGPDLLKVHSTDVGHAELLRAVASSGLPVSLACSGSTDDELLEGTIHRGFRSRRETR